MVVDGEDVHTQRMADSNIPLIPCSHISNSALFHLLSNPFVNLLGIWNAVSNAPVFLSILVFVFGRNLAARSGLEETGCHSVTSVRRDADSPSSLHQISIGFVVAFSVCTDE